MQAEPRQDVTEGTRTPGDRRLSTIKEVVDRLPRADDAVPESLAPTPQMRRSVHVHSGRPGRTGRVIAGAAPPEA